MESEGSFIHTHLGIEVIGGVKVLDYQKEGCTVWMDVDAAEGQGNVILPLLAYKGYRCELTEQGDSELAAEAGVDKEILGKWEDGRLALNLGTGLKGRLKVYFKEPILWRVAEIVSLVSILLIYLYCRKGKNREM